MSTFKVSLTLFVDDENMDEEGAYDFVKDSFDGGAIGTYDIKIEQIDDEDDD